MNKFFAVRLPLLAAFAAVALFAGCQSSGIGVSPEPNEERIDAEVEEVFEAARAALGEMGFRPVRSRPARATLEAATPVRYDYSVRESAQTRAVVTVVPDPEGSRLQYRFSRVVEVEDGAHGSRSHETPLRDEQLHEDFVGEVKRQLSQQPGE